MKPLAMLFIVGAVCFPVSAQPSSTPLFEDSFGVDQLAPGWSWLREVPEDWQLSGGSLKIRTSGQLWGAKNTQKNVLLRDAPTQRAFAVEVTVNGGLQMDQAYEHGGLIWYLDDDHWVTLTQLNHVVDKTQKILLVHETGGRGRDRESHAVPYLPAQVALRLVIEGQRFTGYYRESTKVAWRRLGSIDFPEAPGIPRVGLVAGQGSESANHRVIFKDFAIRPWATSSER